MASLRWLLDSRIWLGLVGALLIGCGREADSTKPHATTPAVLVAEGEARRAATAGVSAIAVEASTAPTSSAERAASIPLRSLQLPGDKLVEEAANSNWESETIGDLAASRLKALGKVMSDPGGFNQQAIVPLVSVNFQCESLLPRDLQIAFRDHTFTVRRPSSDTNASENTRTAMTGASGLRQALRQLLEPLKDANGLRVEQKVVRVEFDESHPRTTSLVHVFGKTPRASVQQNMVWDCEWDRLDNDDLGLAALRVRDYEEVSASPSGAAPFADCTEAAIGASPTYRDVLAYGISYWEDRIEGRFGINPTAWHGLAIGDANGDGLDDVYLCQPGGLPNALFVQLPDGTATDVAADAGVDLRDHTHSELLVDLDNDGDQDLVLGTLVGVVIFSNDGQGKFSPRTTKLTPNGMPFSLSAVDYDGDGDLDLYACCYSKRAGTVSPQLAGSVGRPVPYHDANNGSRNLLLRNNRRWQFPDVTQRVGLGQNNQRFSFAALGGLR